MKLPKRGKFSLRITLSKTKKSSKNKADKGKDGLLEGSYKENKENLVSFSAHCFQVLFNSSDYLHCH